LRPVLLVLICAFALAACGGDDDSSSEKTPAAPKQSGTDLGAIKAYLLDHTQRLSGDVATLKENAQAYHDLAEQSDFDTKQMLAGNQQEVARLLGDAKQTYQDANPAYEEMEGVVAGVPSLADYDVIIDAGGDASDPENAVPFSIKTEDGKTYKQPGNLFFLAESALYGTEPKWSTKGDVDGDGKVEFGESLPDPRFYLAAITEFDKQAKELDASAKEWSPTEQDALTALVVMTPTMSEYFEAWKNSRFIAGDQATEKAFVSSSRLQDIADILGGLKLIYANVEGRIAEANKQQAHQTGQSLGELEAFVARLRDQEANGKKFTGEDADTLGRQAQDQAEAIAGQITQAAKQLNIELET
jgi:Imelysin